MYPKQDKIKIIVFADSKERQKYFNLFRYLMKDKIIRIIESRDEKHLSTEKADIKFLGANESVRGHKCHYALNLTQNIEFHQNLVLACVSPLYSMLREDDDWSELFDKL